MSFRTNAQVYDELNNDKASLILADLLGRTGGRLLIYPDFTPNDIDKQGLWMSPFVSVILCFASLPRATSYIL